MVCQWHQDFGVADPEKVNGELTPWTGDLEPQPGRETCTRCGVSFALKSQLEKHTVLHSNALQVCHVCSKAFANVYRLQRHMISHAEGGALRKFACVECGKAFKFKHHLKEHTRIHSGEKPFSCRHCGKRFSHSGSYSSHMTSKKCWAVGSSSQRDDGGDDDEKTRVLVPKSEPYDAATALRLFPFSSAFLPAPYQLPPCITKAPFTPFSSPGCHIAAPLHYGYAPLSVMEKLRVVSSVDAKTGSDAPNKMATAVKKVLSIVDATISQQAAPPEARVALSRLAQQEAGQDGAKSLSLLAHAATERLAEEEEGGQRNGEEERGGGKSEVRCRYCHCRLPSAVELHQHERYLCVARRNQEVSANDLADGGRKPPQSAVHLSASDQTDDDDDASDDSFLDKDGRRYRVRSLISEAQQTQLKAQFAVNPRPTKVTLTRLAARLGFSKRVVQVWFQNMRARQRRRDRVSEAHGDLCHDPRSDPRRDLRDPCHDLRGDPHGDLPKVKHAGHTQVEPLDLSVKCDSAPSPLTSDQSDEVEALNLSTKSPRVGFNGSAIYKYLRREGLFSSDHSPARPLDLVRRTPERFGCLSPGVASSSVGSPRPSSLDSSFNSTLSSHDNSPPEAQTLLRRGVEFSGHLAGPGVTFSSPFCHQTEHWVGGTRCAEDEVFACESCDKTFSRLSALAQHSQLEHSRRGGGEDSHPDTLDFRPLITMVTEPAAILDVVAMATPVKRARRKSWRQVEAESVAELSPGDDTDHSEAGNPLHKRRSWKAHRVDAPLDGATSGGLYGCDQCEKTFGKQSSLARHKYEHSGLRPFQCSDCGKAFKHKHHLTEHQRLHSGEKPFSCSKCGKRFSHSGSYSQHMNHRYKYCKPGGSTDDGEIGENGDCEMQPAI